MGLFLRQDGGRSELQTKVASDVRERMAKRTALGGDSPDETSTEQKPSPASRTNTALIIMVIFFITIFLLSVITLLIAIL